MDFEYHYSPQQQEFRKEVRSWIQANVPAGLKHPPDPKHMDRETFDWVVEFRQKLGRKGWLHPTYPKEYGGGGLSAEYDVIIQEEIRDADLPLIIHDNTLDLPSLFVWGTEEQKKEFLPPRLRGEKLAWQLFTEPGAGSDLASLKTRAVKDGDDWLITGEKVFVGGDAGYLSPDMKTPDLKQMGEFFCLAVTDQNAPRHRNMGYFYIPGETPGITVQTLDLLVGHGKRQVYLDNVRVPSSRLIGAAGQGWQVAQTTLEIEHGGGGQVVARNNVSGRMIEYARKTGVLKDSHKLHAIMDAYIDMEIGRLIGLRNYAMYSQKMEMTYHGSQNSLWRKESLLRVADNIREAFGLTSLLDLNDPGAPFEGEFEQHQRESLAAAHPGGTIEVQRVIIARRLGVSRTKERAAPTPSTASKKQ